MVNSFLGKAVDNAACQPKLWLYRAISIMKAVPWYSQKVSILANLSAPQREAAEATDGPVLIVAGAGAGKTKTITHRIGHLIEKGVPPFKILAVTFTNKAAAEMRERVRSLVGEGKTLPIVSTFHSLCVRILREFHEAAHLPRGFVIWDRDDSIRALKRILDAHDESIAPRAVISRISREKGDGGSSAELEVAAKHFRDRAIARAWRDYEKMMQEEGALDFDDLLVRTLQLLQESAEVRERLQNRWTHITIDEYQDTNRAQYEIARILAAPQNNICVVGDTDQNIYSWRGADIAHLLSFERTFPGAKVVLLEQNYRSTRTIISAANGVIAKNSNRIPKTLFTENKVGDAITFYQAQNEIDEAWFIATEATKLLRAGVKPKDIAVLYRENFQSRVLEEALLHFGLPYRVLGTRFFDRKEVKDALSYLRASLNPNSRMDVLRIISVPARGIGKVTAEKMLVGLEQELPTAARAKVAGFRQILEKIRSGISILTASEAVRYAIEESGLEALFKKEGDEGLERLENVQELINFATRYDTLTPPEGIERLLEDAALQSEQDQLEDPQDAISLMTVHASKGLEFDAVFVSGLEQGLFPWVKPEDTTRDPEEERRLFYVALTRAKERLFLSLASRRLKYGSTEYSVPSEFLDDIDSRLMQYARVEQGGHDEQTIT